MDLVTHGDAMSQLRPFDLLDREHCTVDALRTQAKVSTSPQYPAGVAFACAELP